MNVYLIIISFAFGGAADGGAATSMTQVPMATKAACEAAAKVAQRDGVEWKNGFVSAGHRRVEAFCVEQK